MKVKSRPMKQIVVRAEIVRSWSSKILRMHVSMAFVHSQGLGLPKSVGSLQGVPQNRLAQIIVKVMERQAK